MNEFQQLLMDLIRLKPVSKDTEAVNQTENRMKQFLDGHGLYTVMETIGDRQVLFASTKADTGKKPDYLFNAHLDVVPGEAEQFSPRIEGSRMYGRGTQDCLGSAVVIASALVALKDKVSCGAIFSADEEIGGLTTGGMVSLGYGAKKCIVIVDAGYDVLAYAQKGVLSVELVNHSKTGGGHASIPWCFDNPIDRLIDGYVRLRSSWTNPTAEAQWSNSLTPCIFHAGAVHNQIPGEASMTLNIRFIKPEDKDQILTRIKELTGCDEVRIVETCPPVVTDADAPAVRRLRSLMARYIGCEISLDRMNGATDARYFAALHVPLAMIGVKGDGEHSPCEYIELESMDIVKSILVDFAGE